MFASLVKIQTEFPDLHIGDVLISMKGFSGVHPLKTIISS